MSDLHEDFGPTLWVVNTIFIVLATFSVIGRFGARRLRKLSLGADDWMICVALFFDWVLYGIFVGCRVNGLGRHRAVLSPEKVAIFSELLYFFQIFYVLGPPSVKLALLFLYRRIFEHSRFLLMINGMIAFVAVWATIMAFLAIFNCNPISAFWTMEGTCLDFKQFAIGYAIVNIITDFTVWLMPIPSVWKIQLPTPQKIALSLIFALGLLYETPILRLQRKIKKRFADGHVRSDCAAAMARLLLSMLVLGEYDSTWLYGKGYMWSIIEVSTGIVCTCLPTMRAILKTAFGGKFAKLLGMSSGKVSHRPSNNTPWSKTSEYYNDIGEVRAAKVSSGLYRGGPSNDDPGWDASSQQILVTEEVDVELQSVKNVARRT